MASGKRNSLGRSSKTKDNPILPAVEPAAAHHLGPEESSPFPIVGIGASAGGLDALNSLLPSLAPDSGMAFVVVLHLHPTFDSRLSEILARASTLPVEQIENKVRVLPNHVYIIPPGKDLVLGDGLLQLSPRTEQHGVHRPIDHFLRSLAQERGYRSIGVILSGTGNDGTLGMEEVKAAGGITFAQDDSADETSMPHSAVASGCVDFVLPPAEIGQELRRIGRHPYVGAPDGVRALGESGMRQTLDLLRKTTGVDFTDYKHNTLYRRITRRMMLQKFDSLHEYLRLLQRNPAEVEALYRDILINVTSFFRNPESYEALKSKVFPRLTEGRSRHQQVRIWALGCSTGEEAYSLAMTYSEYAEESGRSVPLQVFATDLNGAGIDKARVGVYSKSIAQDVSPERLRRFFVEIDGSYRISKAIRDMCIFARQNVLADPPFSNINLIACRNLLIYLEPVLQKRLLPLLHYALQPDGFLWLGSSETIGSYRDLFDAEDAKHRLYIRKPASSRVPLEARGSVRLPPVRGSIGRAERSREPTAVDLQKEPDRMLLARYAPPAVVIDPECNVLQFRGDTSAFLAQAPGKASLALLKMLREGLLVGVRSAIHKARREQVPATQKGLRVKGERGYRMVDVTVLPVGAGKGDGRMLVLFEEQHAPIARAPKAAKPAPKAARHVLPEDERAHLEQELAATREYLQSVIEQQEAANEELQSANEEVQSSNEELQSTNEELQTSKEEIQSSNEELATVNEELHNRNRELAQSNNDLSNLLVSVQTPIVMLGPDLRIRRFTPPAGTLLNLIASDVGRPISDIKLNLSVGDFESLLAEVMHSFKGRELEVRDRSGRWHLLRVHPYKTQDDRIDGAVMMLIDIESLKRAEESVRESEARFQLLANSAPVLMWVNDLQGCRFVNRAYLEFVDVDESQIKGRDHLQFVHPDDREGYAAGYAAAQAEKRQFSRRFRFRRADGIYRWMKAVGVPRFDAAGGLLGYVGCSVDVTEFKETESALLEADHSKNEFLAMLAHELRNPLAALRNSAQVIATQGAAREAVSRASEIMVRQTGNMVRMVDDLMDVSRITHGSIQLRPEIIDLAACLRLAIDDSSHEFGAGAPVLHVSLPPEPVPIRADPTRLGQVISNLLGNASRFARREGGGQVWLSLQREPAVEGGLAHAVVRVRDDGSGIDPKVLPRVFEMFYQGPDTAAAQIQGLGIGLSLARSLVALHGGTIEARNCSGQGSEFTVRLPIALAATVEPAPPQRLIPAATPCRVLVVDDNVDAAHVLGLVLEMSGHQVKVVHDGNAALHEALAFEPDLVLLDIAMPRMNGHDTAQRMRSELPRQPLLVAVTGFGQKDDIRKSLEAGFEEHLTKPIDIAVLARLTERATRKGMV